ncbi:MAG: T9SS type A sorting domain-containing protein [Bacteroidia bacterium]
MKLKLILLALCFSFMAVKGQTWCPPGATWYYSTEIPGMNGYSKYSYTSDTIVNNINCKKITTFYEGYSWSFPQGIYSEFGNPFYTYEQNGVAYIYNQFYGNNKFDTLFNMNAQIGDKWRIALVDTACADSLYFMKVLNIGTKLLNGVNLKWLYVKKGPFDNGNGEMSYTHDTIVERIGYKYDEGKYAICYGAIAEYYLSNLRCYSDSTFGLYSTGISTSCDYFTTSIEESNLKSLSFSIYPNPAIGELNINLNSPIANESTIKIYDLYSKLVERIHLKTGITYAYNTNLLPYGMYMVSLYIENELIETKKLVLIK